ncbi:MULTISPECIES: FG-GAP-like repeat-containing protein [unclassified Streptomyces]|uniref:FG-GAP-like repeat-containing protein n=1 Tax=unclassified Streptomyces TaxID=2593676 RepID=UPI001EF01B24|nr:MULTISPECIES: FG-GAP-like repeat-containing protein [unclassified Streptomyces]
MTVSTLPVDAASSDQSGSHERIGVVFGSAHGLDPTTRAVYERGDFGLPPRDTQSAGSARSISTSGLVNGDLDGDGFPDFVSLVQGGNIPDAYGNSTTARRLDQYVTWGSPAGPDGGKATRIRLPAEAKDGLSLVVRGDFDGDGHLDLAANDAGMRGKVWLLYGPIDRSTGAPARTATLPGHGAGLYADAVDPEHPRRTGLLVSSGDDGEQADGVWYADVRTGRGRTLRKGNAHAFGDFDGDGRRDLAVGDDGNRNDEPGYESEAPEVDGSLAVYPGDGGAPVTYEVPEPEGRPRYGLGFYLAADPDGDGRDGLLVTGGGGGVTLIDGDARTRVQRQGPARRGGKKVSATRRAAHVVTVADFDGDGKDEVVWAWGWFGGGGDRSDEATHWWVARGVSTRDTTSFVTSGFAR